jgi:protein-S-isoprenylcysteine O-methyltransferase Ste14
MGFRVARRAACGMAGTMPTPPHARAADPGTDNPQAIPRWFQIGLRLVAAGFMVWFSVSAWHFWQKEDGSYSHSISPLELVPKLISVVKNPPSAESLGAFARWVLVWAAVTLLLLPVRLRVVLRFGAAAALGIFVLRALHQYQAAEARRVLRALFLDQEDPEADSSRVTLGLWVATEVTTVLLILAARAPRRQDWRPVSALCTAGATFYFLWLDFDYASIRSFIPDWAGAAIVGFGLAWQVFAKLSLGRSFGLLPADRGIVTRGAYHFMRHPVYFGYFASDAGFMLTNFSWGNLAIYLCYATFQVMRVIREEKLLRANPEYQAYCQKVRWRFVPFVF